MSSFKVKELMLGLADFFEVILSNEDLEKGVISIESVDISLQHIAVKEHSRLVLSATVDTLEEQLQGSIFPYIMSAHFHWKGTEGGTLGFEPESRQLVYCFSPQFENPWNKKPNEIAQILFLIYDQVSYWQDLIDQVRQGADLPSIEQLHHMNTFADHQKSLH